MTKIQANNIDLQTTGDRAMQNSGGSLEQGSGTGKDIVATDVDLSATLSGTAAGSTVEASLITLDTHTHPGGSGVLAEWVATSSVSSSPTLVFPSAVKSFRYIAYTKALSAGGSHQVEINSGGANFYLNLSANNDAGNMFSEGVVSQDINGRYIIIWRANYPGSPTPVHHGTQTTVGIGGLITSVRFFQNGFGFIGFDAGHHVKVTV
jgi:hypothetical protein